MIIVVGLQLLDYQEPQAVESFAHCLGFLYANNPAITLRVKVSYRSKTYIAGEKFISYARSLKADYLFMTAGDIVLKPTAIQRLIDSNLPVVSGLTVSNRDGKTPFTFFRVSKGFFRFKEVDLTEELVQVDNPGSGSLLIRQDVLNRLSKYPFGCFKGIPEGDTSFFEELHELGIKPYINTKVKVGHVAHDKLIYKME